MEEIEKLKHTQMYAYPNPFDQNTVLTFENCTKGVMYLEVVNSLGASVHRETVVDVDGIQQYSADLSGLPSGAYYLRMVCPADGWNASVSVLKTGSQVSGSRTSLRDMLGVQKRGLFDGK